MRLYRQKYFTEEEEDKEAKARANKKRKDMIDKTTNLLFRLPSYRVPDKVVDSDRYFSDDEKKNGHRR